MNSGIISIKRKEIYPRTRVLSLQNQDQRIEFSGKMDVVKELNRQSDDITTLSIRKKRKISFAICHRCFRQQKNECQTGQNIGCCYCLDKRTDDEASIRYLDGIGDIDTRKFGMIFLKDMYYCPHCRKTKISSAEFDIILRQNVVNANFFGESNMLI